MERGKHAKGGLRRETLGAKQTDKHTDTASHRDRDQSTLTNVYTFRHSKYSNYVRNLRVYPGTRLTTYTIVLCRKHPQMGGDSTRADMSLLLCGRLGACLRWINQ